jgi:hypothetical protein
LQLQQVAIAERGKWDANANPSSSVGCAIRNDVAVPKRRQGSHFWQFRLRKLRFLAGGVEFREADS